MCRREQRATEGDVRPRVQKRASGQQVARSRYPTDGQTRGPNYAIAWGYLPTNFGAIGTIVLEIQPTPSLPACCLLEMGIHHLDLPGLGQPKSGSSSVTLWVPISLNTWYLKEWSLRVSAFREGNALAPGVGGPLSGGWGGGYVTDARQGLGT